MERIWAIACRKGSNRVALGYDEGSTMIKMGKEQPVASMDQSGKIIWARHTEIQMVNVKSATGEAVVDGERLPLVVKELGNCEVIKLVFSGICECFLLWNQPTPLAMFYDAFIWNRYTLNRFAMIQKGAWPWYAVTENTSFTRSCLFRKYL